MMTPTQELEKLIDVLMVHYMSLLSESVMSKDFDLRRLGEQSVAESARSAIVDGTLYIRPYESLDDMIPHLKSRDQFFVEAMKCVRDSIWEKLDRMIGDFHDGKRSCVIPEDSV